MPTRAKTINSETRKGRHRLYGYRWQRERALYLAEHPLCVACKRDGTTTAAKVVDHIVPHRGSYERFWDVENWSALCVVCHNKKTARGD